MRHARTGSRLRRFTAVALLAAGFFATAEAPATATLPVDADERTAFAAGYQRSVGDEMTMYATFVVPRANSCDLGDGSVTMKAMVTAGAVKVGAEITSTCEAGSAHYSGSSFLGGGPNPVYGRIRGGDWITVQVRDSRHQTDVLVSSVRGWAEGGARVPLDLRGASLTVEATGDLTSAESAGGLGAQRFKLLRLNDHRLGSFDLDPFDDACSSVSRLRQRQTFTTKFTC